MKKCVNCQTEIPLNSRFCLNCGAAQPAARPTSAADGQLQPAEEKNQSQEEEVDWLAREASLDPNLDYSAQLRFGGFAERGIGCLVGGFFVIMGLVALVPAVPLMAIFGLPLAIILGLLTYFNVGQLQEKWRGNRFLRNLPGFRSPKAGTLALSVFLHLVFLWGACYLLLTITLRR